MFCVAASLGRLYQAISTSRTPFNNAKSGGQSSFPCSVEEGERLEERKEENVQILLKISKYLLICCHEKFTFLCFDTSRSDLGLIVCNFVLCFFLGQICGKLHTLLYFYI